MNRRTNLMIGVETRTQKRAILNTLRRIIPELAHVGMEGHDSAPFSVLTEASRQEVNQALPLYLRRGALFWSAFAPTRRRRRYS